MSFSDNCHFPLVFSRFVSLIILVQFIFFLKSEQRHFNYPGTCLYVFVLSVVKISDSFTACPQHCQLYFNT